MPALSKGIISLWYGSIVSIPAGFVLCDGNNGTPDLRDNFVIGAGNSHAPDDSGGNSTHSHAFTSDGHFHTMPGGFGIAGGGDKAAELTSSVVSGTTQNGTSLPPYYALAYIMKT